MRLDLVLLVGTDARDSNCELADIVVFQSFVQGEPVIYAAHDKWGNFSSSFGDGAKVGVRSGGITSGVNNVPASPAVRGGAGAERAHGGPEG